MSSVCPECEAETIQSGPELRHKPAELRLGIKDELTVRRHEEAGVDLFGVAEVRLNLLPCGIKPPLMDAARFDVEHVVTDLRVTGSCLLWGMFSCFLTEHKLSQRLGVNEVFLCASTAV